MKSNYIIILLIGVVSLVFNSCCRKTPISSISCKLNEMVKGDSCTCDNNSIRVNGECKFIRPNFSKKFPDAKHCFATITKNCGDYRDSLIMPYIDGMFSLSSNSFSIGNYDGNRENAICDMDYYQTGTLYDSISSEIQMVLYDRPTRYFGLYMRMNKNRDTVYATICNTQWFPFYKRLDTCNSIMTRLF